ncbi:MAG TPA: hypothetical protein VLM19_00425 [Nitrospiraceae bacterium]|nr:hypothetical protein [Nitrospiraceae bacterium]
MTRLVSFLLALCLTSPSWAFPDNAVLENFTGADNTSPPNANWTNAVFVGASSGNLRIRSNAAATSSTGVDGEACWNPTTFDADCEAYATITDVASTSFGQLYARLVNIGANTTDGYRAEWADGTSAITIDRIDNGVVTQLGATVTQAIMTTDKIGMKLVGDQICLWFSDSGGAWTELTCRTDATYSAGGRIGMGVNNNALVGSMDDFGGGNVTAAFPGGTRRRGG